LSKEDVSELSHAINRQLGRVFRKNEFFYRGFGGRVAGGGGAKAAEKPAVEVKSTFDLKLVGFDAKAKIKVIKEVRSIAGLGLKESKDLVEGVPAVIQKNLSTEKAEELKKLLESVGATVELV
jgi:large subunit ribosomal protein L7/L12